MRIDLALNIKTGDIIYDCFMEKLIVTSVYKDHSKLIFGTINSRLSRSGYSYEDVYLQDLYGESDEEISWINWINNNKDIVNTFDDIENAKKLYKIGFGQGFQHRQKISYEEMMQK